MSISIVGPVQRIGDQLALRIPLHTRGAELAPLVEQIGMIEEGYLVITIPERLARTLRIHEGSQVIVDNLNGKFTITRDEPD